MAEFPFDPIVVGNLCKSCCPDCTTKLNDPNAKCCNENGTKKCYKPADCKKCTGSDPNLTLIDDCNTGENLAKGKTSCCNGICYSNICYKCEDNKVVPNYDTKKYGCCRHGGKYRLGTCKKCDFGFVDFLPEEDVLVDECNSLQKCCEGKCITNFDDPCKKCDKVTEDKPSGTLIETCKDNPSGSDCCGGTCWDSKKQTCKECINEEELVDKKDCDCCTDKNTGNQSCCDPSKKERCCASTGECVKVCEECN